VSYQSFNFFMFCAVVLLLYYIVGGKLQKYVLLLANTVFFAYAGTKYLPYLLVTTVSTYTSGAVIGSIYKKADIKLNECDDSAAKKGIRGRAKKQAEIALIIALIISVGLLAVCKYTGFVVENINIILDKLGQEAIDSTSLSIALPLGISFYTFMAISYVLDVLWKRYEAERNFISYAVFLTYFPHIVQGPIDRYNEFNAQIKNGVKLSLDNLSCGFELFVWGLFKKLVIADRLGVFVGEVFDNFEGYGGIVLIIAVALYSIQIYADFSGCIDIVTGISEMLGIKLRKNFNHPYFSRTMGEFWRRWHISLQEWFKDYIYYPVSSSAFTKKIKKKFKNKGHKRAEALFASCFPVLVVWLITGIWHGAAWRFVVWGLFHATLLIGGQVLEPMFTKAKKALHINDNSLGFHTFQIIRTFAFCCIGRVFFRADNLEDAFLIFRQIFTQFNGLSVIAFGYSACGITVKDIALIHFAIIVLLCVDLLQEKMHLREFLSKQSIILRWSLLFIGLFAVIVFGIYGPGYNASNFIYEQF